MKAFGEGVYSGLFSVLNELGEDNLSFKLGLNYLRALSNELFLSLEILHLVPDSLPWLDLALHLHQGQ